MKRSLILMFGLALFAPVALLGCGEETGTTTKTTTTTPEGTKTDKVESTSTTTGGEKTETPK